MNIKPKNSKKYTHNIRRYGMNFYDFIYNANEDGRYVLIVLCLIFIIAIWGITHFSAECGSQVSIFRLVQYTKKCPVQRSVLNETTPQSSQNTGFVSKGSQNSVFSRCAVLVKDSSNRTDWHLTQLIVTLLKDRGIKARLLSDRFFENRSVFNKAYGGEENEILQLKQMQPAEFYILAKKEVKISTSPDLENMTTAAMILSMNVIASNTSQIVHNLSLTENGPGFSSDNAVEMAKERVNVTLKHQIQSISLLSN